ncbi:hypothetical protein NRIC_20540 [Enterococcus florum]|uniref:Saccharopine dehydrogenase NADP binding domain-containing protein n=1 Tax=Enterococcus florum TaxID=2480627 RepID=A0A4P5PLL7_9ENTE|nr:saccharopine dehydrogenase NADP-binding domain-containing protein [Enterococcus florum]GCF94163.1 hypothetical protein NRIC_20540 [Enterococcus florum]
MEKLFIIGGYGDVGKAAVKELLVHTKQEIIIGGRHLHRANIFLETLDTSRVSFRQIDVCDEATYFHQLADVSFVLMCLSTKTMEFAAYCLKKGIHYLDISASSRPTMQLVELKKADIRASAILGIGICPGLSTLLARELSKKFDVVTKTELSLLLGIGDHYGKDALMWLLDHLSRPFDWTIDQKVVKKTPFLNKNLIAFFPSEKPYAVYNFDLADQQIITQLLQQTNVTTSFGLADRNLTKALSALANLRFFYLLRYQGVYHLALRFAHISTQFAKKATPHFAIHVNVTGTKDQKEFSSEQTIHGVNSSETTGKVLARTYCLISKSRLSNGVYYLPQVVEIEQFSDFL